MILKARIVNERDNFIHILKISTKCSETRKRIVDSSRLKMWFYNNLNMLHALRRSNLPQSIDLKESESISCHALRVFVTVWFFFLRAGWGTSLKKRCLFAIMQRKASENFFAGYWCVLLLSRRFASDQHNFLESDQHNIFTWMHQGRSKTIR